MIQRGRIVKKRTPRRNGLRIRRDAFAVSTFADADKLLASEDVAAASDAC